MKKLALVVMLVCAGVWALPTNEALIPIGPKTPGQLQTHYAAPNPATEKPGFVPHDSRYDLLFAQTATGQGAAVACQWDSVYPFEAEFADNFSIPGGGTVDSIVWWGYYWNPGPPGNILDFWLKIFPDSTGFNMPKAAPVYAQRASFTEIDLGGMAWFRYEATFPAFVASAGVTYWIVLQSTLIFPPQWGNNASYPGGSPSFGDGQMGYFRSALLGFPNWAPAIVLGLPYESSFEIWGTGGGVFHDVGVQNVVSPPAGSVTVGDYDVIGRVRNYGTETETFDVTAEVYDTTGGAWTNIFDVTVTLTDFPSAGDSNVNFGTVSFADNSIYYTEIFTELVGDENTGNDTASAYSTTALALGDVIYELDVQTPTGDIRLLGVEFDGSYFYVSGAKDFDTAFVYVIDTLGNVIWRITQPPSYWGDWGWRDLAWDFVYAGADRIDTLYASYTSNVDVFSIDLTSGTRIDQGTYPGPQAPNRAMAWDDDSSWFFTANWDPCYKFSKSSSNLGSVPGPGSVYGAAYDTDTTDGGWIWWHSQNDVGTGYFLRIDQMDPITMTWTGLYFGYVPTLCNPGSMAGGLCFYEGFRNADVLFAMVQGDPVDQIVGIFVRSHVGVEENDQALKKPSFGFAPSRTIVTNTASLAYTLTRTGMVSLKVYDGAGRAVQTLVSAVEPAGTKTITWSTSHLENGVYFVRLEAEGKVATQKLIVLN